SVELKLNSKLQTRIIPCLRSLWMSPGLPELLQLFFGKGKLHYLKTLKYGRIEVWKESFTFQEISRKPKRGTSNKTWQCPRKKGLISYNDYATNIIRLKMRIEKDFKEFIELLNCNKVKYLVVGGFAIAFHATARFTKDIDIFVEASEENSIKIVNTLKSFGFGDIGLTEKDFQNAGQIVQLGYPPLRIDIITAISGVEFADAWKTKVEGKYGDAPCFFISIDDLINNKNASGRPQDLADIKILERIKKISNR
ncbi:MAG: hypothetical protein QG657_356, partial [Acidobacteriota bacterium]|nr:hypothetical protein [Acidobacteriota bacterium]